MVSSAACTAFAGNFTTNVQRCTGSAVEESGPASGADVDGLALTAPSAPTTSPPREVKRGARVVLGDELVARQADLHLVELADVDGDRLALVERHHVAARVDDRDRRTGAPAGQRA